MYAVVEYNNYRKEQYFEVKYVTNDLEYAKKMAFNNAKNDIPKDESTYRLTTNIEEIHLRPLNESIINYTIVEVIEYKIGFKIVMTFSNVYSVIKLPEYPKIEVLDNIDEKIICNNFYSYYDTDDTDDTDE